MSLAQEILNARDLNREAVPTPWWPSVDGALFLQEFGAETRQQVVAWHDEAAVDYAKPPNLYGRVVALALCDQSGELVFDENEIEAFGRKNGQRLYELYKKVLKLNGMSKEEQANLEKKSETTPRNDSSTSSASTASAEPPTPTTSDEG